MAKFFLIGGGGIGKPNKEKYQVRALDEEIINMTGKKSPQLLFIGVASHKTEDEYFLTIQKNFSALNCECAHLNKVDIKDEAKARKMFDAADIIYVGGGNTIHLMQVFRKHNIFPLFEKAIAENKVLTGMSAGAICYCEFGNSGSRVLKSNPNQPVKVAGMGFVKMLFCPHINSNKNRLPAMENMLKSESLEGYALDDLVAIKIVNESMTFLGTREKLKIFKCYFDGNKKFIKEKVDYHILGN